MNIFCAFSTKSSFNIIVLGAISLIIGIYAEDAVNQSKLRNQVQQLMKELKESLPSLPSLPSGYELHLSYDADESIKDEMNKIYFRSKLTVFILLCFVSLIYRNLTYEYFAVISKL